jgi:UDP-glucose 4-epimerase
MDLKAKTILITGNGSFAFAMAKRLLETNIKQIIIFSHSEKPQQENKIRLNDNRVKFIYGDIRDYDAIEEATIDVDYVLHSAAMKYIDICEINPKECKKTNIDGSGNVIKACINNKVKKLVCLSTDKAVNPTTVYGNSKQQMELLSRNINNRETNIILTRYGNVLKSNGSVIPLFQDQKSKGKPLTITDPNMTRFFMTLDQAVDLVLYALENGTNGDLFVYNNKSCTIKDIADCISNNQIITGQRCIEKMHEELLTKEELNNSELIGDFYRVNKNICSDCKIVKYDKPFTSDIAPRFTHEELSELISKS